MLDDKMPEENQAQKEPEPLNQPPRMAASTSPSAPSSALSEPSAQIPSAQQTTPVSGMPLTEPSAGHTEVNQPQAVASGSSGFQSRTPFRGFWRLFANAWHNYWPHFWTFVKLNLLSFILLTIIIFIPVMGIMIRTLWIPVYSETLGVFLIILGIILATILLGIIIIWFLRLFTANIVLACRIAAGKEKIGVFDLLKIAKHNVGKIIGVAILAGLAVMAGQLLLVIPGLIFLTWFSLAAFAVVFEDLGAIKSMGRSYNLIRGYGWETFYLMAGIALLTGLLGLLIQLIGGAGLILGLIFGTALGGETAGLITGLGTAILVALVFAGLVSLLAPIWEIMPAMRYLDLKNIKDNNLPKTESAAKAAIISIILALIWAPLIGWSMWANYQELTGKKTKIQPATEATKEKSFEEQIEFSKEEAQIRARDTIRKNDLMQLKTALNNYHQDNGRYPIESGVPGPVPMPQLSKYTSLDTSNRPIGEFSYLYLTSPDGHKFTLFTKFENPNDPDIKTSGPTPDIPLPEGYNYWITSE